ncbi:hypothetical protein MRB53_011410 [Persea americana]|uniref:Uncharacterized protein n=1 Tax=Persea americana TaxID=3435 RepID=A0ACC2LVC7_PERAE|nr:hypothetical protein MRB53_011410 [Persea americana]
MLVRPGPLVALMDRRFMLERRKSLRGAGDSFLSGWQSFRSSPLLFLAASSEIDGGKKRRKKKWADSVYGAYSLAMLFPIDFISKSLSPNTATMQHRRTSIKKLTMHQPSQVSRKLCDTIVFSQRPQKMVEASTDGEKAEVLALGEDFRWLYDNATGDEGELGGHPCGPMLQMPK